MSAGGAGGGVRLVGLVKRFGGVAAVDGVDLDVAPGEFVALLGPSGCGKTTCLRLVAGFEQPDGGAVLVDGRDVTPLPPARRDVNTVFQSYALFGHLDVAGNVGFGLRRRRVSAAERRRRVDEALEMVRLAPLRHRRPRELSGGQQQRVALARALVLRPRVLLLDEPLAALDLQLRKDMQVELASLHREVGCTFVFVTHDQNEALGLADRVAVMRDGRIEQLGTPTEVYDRPATAFVASFVGDMSTLAGTAAGGRVETPAGVLALPGAPDGAVTVGVRPENVTVAPLPGRAEGALRARVESADVVGDALRIRLVLPGGGRLAAKRPRSEHASLSGLRPGDEVAWAFDPVSAVVHPAAPGAGAVAVAAGGPTAGEPG